MLTMNATRYLVDVLAKPSMQSHGLNTDQIAHLEACNAAPPMGWLARWQAARHARRQQAAINRTLRLLSPLTRADLGLSSMRPTTLAR